jgi:hypothetical protein
MKLRLPLALSCCLALLAAAGAAPDESLPSEKAALDKVSPSDTKGLVLTDLAGFVGNLTGKSPSEKLTRVDVDLDALGQEGDQVPVAKDAPWRGLRLPTRGGSGTPMIDLNEVRIKVLLFGKDGAPARKVEAGTRVVLKIGDKTYTSFEALAKRIAQTKPTAPLILDVRSAVPARFALTALAVACNSKRPLQIAAPGMGGALPRYAKVRAALGEAIRGAAKDSEGNFKVGVRIRPDARCAWRSIQAVLTYAAQHRISRVTLVGKAGEQEVELYRPAAQGVVITRREVRPQEYDEKLKRDMHRTPKVGGKDMVEKPIIILEDEVEIPADKNKSKGTDLSHLGKGKLDSTSVNDALGVGRGSYGKRFGKDGLEAEGGSAETETAVAAGLVWLEKHQRANGSWSAKGDTCKDCESKTSWGAAAGDARYDVGVTSLALLAYLGNGHTHRFGNHKRVVNKGLRYLKQVQKADGSIGFAQGESIYNHAYATLALCEAYAVSRDFTLKAQAQKAIGFVLKAQNPNLGWQYGVKPGRNDSSVTGAMLQALLAGRTAGLKVPGSALEGATAWLARATNREGNTGYQTPGGGSSYLPGTDGKFDALPVNTAITIFGRRMEGDAADQFEKARKHLDRALPAWEKRKINFYYWYYATNAQFQLGGDGWKAWSTALQATLVPSQETKGCAKGSWKPHGEWCIVGGRVYSTAMATLSLETYYRYARK